MNNAKKSLVPHRRFKEFQNAGAWEQRKLGDISKTKRGLTYKPFNIDNTGIRVLRSSNIKEDTFVISDDDVFVKESAVNIPFVENGDILITAANGSTNLVGKHAIIRDIPKNSAVHGGFMLITTSKEYEFLNALMSSNWYKKFIKKYVAGGNGAIGNLRKNDLDNQKIYVPKKDEQEKIGNFFKMLDSLITLHQRKLNKLKKLKSAYLTEMFPDEGEHKPKRRFAGFTDDWEQRKLEDISIINPKSVIPEHFKYVDLESVVGTDLISFIETDKNSAPSRAQRVARTGDIFYQTVRPYQKNNYLFTLKDKDYVFSTGYAQIRSDVDNAFLMSYLQNENFVQTVLRHSTGTSYPAISPSDLAKISVFIPKKQKEQLKIGKAFSNIDNLITLHQRKIDKLQKLKNAYLNEMFV